MKSNWTVIDTALITQAPSTLSIFKDTEYVSIVWRESTKLNTLCLFGIILLKVENITHSQQVKREVSKLFIIFNDLTHFPKQFCKI